MKYVTRLFTAVLIFWSASASSGFVDGSLLHKWATSSSQSIIDDMDYATMLMSYIEGVVDTSKDALCVPTGAETGELYKSAKELGPDNSEELATAFMIGELYKKVEKHLQENPEKWHMGGSDLVLEALEPSFGCKSKRQAKGVFVDGYELQKRIFSNKSSELGPMGFIEGVVDTTEDALICVPSGIKIGQLYAIVKKFIRNNPEKWHKSASSLVIEALKPTFNCKRRK